MSFPNGSIQLSGAIGTTSSTDTFATHYDHLGFGGMRAVADNTARDAITSDRRAFGMMVFSVGANKLYKLSNISMGGSSDTLTDNSNWIEFSSGSGEQGPAGPAGADGADGADGRTILSGSTAPSSETGADGDFYLNTSTSDLYGPKTSGSWGSPASLIGAEGPQGIQGPKGDTGDQGPQGIQGLKGDTGDTGPKGDQGDKGDTGETGSTGPAGTDGKTILSGSTAPDSGIGSDGDLYLNTTTSDLYGPKTSGSWGSAVSLIGATGSQGIQGPQGEAGPEGPQGPKGDTGDTGSQGPQGSAGANGVDGKTILSGSGTPSSELGSNGDFYLNTSTSDLYGPKASGSWGSPVSLIGPTGPQGPKGDAGTAGDPATFLTSSITNGDTTHAPNGDAVYDALAAKLSLSGGTLTGALDMGTHGIGNATFITDGDDLSDAASKYALSATQLSFSDTVFGNQVSSSVGSGQINLTNYNPTTTVQKNFNASVTEIAVYLNGDGSQYAAIQKDKIYINNYNSTGDNTNFRLNINATTGTSIQSQNSGSNSGIDFSGERIKNIATPTASADAASKGYVDTGLSGKQATITGAASTVVTQNLPASMALRSDASGKIMPAATTALELDVLSGISTSVTLRQQLLLKAAFKGYIVGSSGQVTAGAATHSTISSAITDASAGDKIIVLPGTYTENVTVSKKLTIEGMGHSSQIDGTLTVTTDADYSCIRMLRLGGNVTLNSGATGVFLRDCWLASGATVTDSGTSNSILIIQE